MPVGWLMPLCAFAKPGGRSTNVFRVQGLGLKA